jgi:quinol monooxygenase YgiN
MPAERSSAFVVLAQFDVPEADLNDFLQAAADDARHSLADEPDCLQFDVVVDRDRPGAVAFYEVYASQEAFDAHLETAHLARFRESLARLQVTEHAPRFFSRSDP